MPEYFLPQKASQMPKRRLGGSDAVLSLASTASPLAATGGRNAA